MTATEYAPKYHREKSDERGITLIEAMMAIVIALAVLAGGLALYTQTRQSAQLNQLNDGAEQLARRVQDTALLNPGFVGLDRDQVNLENLPHPWSTPDRGWAVGSVNDFAIPGNREWAVYIGNVPADICPRAVSALSGNFAVTTRHARVSGGAVNMAASRSAPNCAEPPNSGEQLIIALADHDRNWNSLAHAGGGTMTATAAPARFLGMRISVGELQRSSLFSDARVLNIASALEETRNLVPGDAQSSGETWRYERKLACANDPDIIVGNTGSHRQPGPTDVDAFRANFLTNTLNNAYRRGCTSLIGVGQQRQGGQWAPVETFGARSLEEHVFNEQFQIFIYNLNHNLYHHR